VTGEENLMQTSGFVYGVAKRLVTGPPIYYVWVGLLLVTAGIGIANYVVQLQRGLITTGMTSYVSWGFYIGNFTFLVGVAAAAVLLIIPAYLYDFGPIRDIVIVGEALAVSAISMCLMFVTADLGRPDRVWHLIPGLGILNLPSSLLSWDIVVLNGYLLLNLLIPGYILAHAYHNKPVNMRIIWPFILLSIPWAVSIHTVTAFIYNGLAARPFWNASILAPRFLASAFCSGPALIILLYQIIRHYSKFNVKDEALFKIAEMIAIAMAVNLFLLVAEFYKELYSDTHHLSPLQYLYMGLHGKDMLVPWIRTALVFNIAAFIIFIIPATRKNFATLNIGCVLIIIGIWIEKGIGLIIPGFIPAPLGEVWEYAPTQLELFVTLGIWAIGLLILTFILKIIIPIELGEFTSRKAGEADLGSQRQHSATSHA
jgi:molybdopterin-containing oxidoreductase family membrane subunit